MNKLTRVRDIGRYINPETGNAVNIKKGDVVNRSTTVLFYMRQGKRIFISDAEFYNFWKRVIRDE